MIVLPVLHHRISGFYTRIKKNLMSPVKELMVVFSIGTDVNQWYPPKVSDNRSFRMSKNAGVFSSSSRFEDLPDRSSLPPCPEGPIGF